MNCMERPICVAQGAQCLTVGSGGPAWAIIGRPLVDGSVALAMFNAGSEAESVTCDVSCLQVSGGTRALFSNTHMCIDAVSNTRTRAYAGSQRTMWAQPFPPWANSTKPWVVRVFFFPTADVLKLCSPFTVAHEGSLLDVLYGACITLCGKWLHVMNDAT